MNTSNYQSEFKKILDRDYFSSKFHQVRNKAFKQFLDKKFLKKNWDSLRFTNLSALKKNTYRLSDASDTAPNNFEYPEPIIKEKYKIVFYNGHYQNHLTFLPDSITIMSNLEYHSDPVNKIMEPSSSPFDILNTAFMDSGMCLKVENNKEIHEPILMMFINSGNDRLMTAPRFHINLGKSSSLELFEHHVGYQIGNFSNTSIFISLQENSFFKHTRLQMDSGCAINTGNIHAEQEDSSQYNLSHFGLGSTLGSLNICSNLNGKGAECHINSLSLTKGNQHLDSHVLINHKSPHCTSSQNFKNVLKEFSSGVFNGKVIVHKDAQKTDSNQSNKNILLSETAKMNSNPQLVIDADDVKCSHGSSTGELDPDALFYLQSRGINKDTAKSMLIYGFIAEIIDSVDNHYIKNFILSEFDKWIEN